jgi:hypothetical protein
MPIFTYQCSKGHRWEELRTRSEGSEVSEEPCRACMERAYAYGHELLDIDLPDFAGKKVPSSVSAVFHGQHTPTFYPNRKENK